MDFDEIRPGLWRWTAVHPEWKPDQKPDSPGDWPPDVGCVAYRGPDALVLIDPLVDEDGWPKLDALVESSGKPVRVLLTIPWHERSRRAALDRYSGSDAVPNGVEAMEIQRAGEVVFWIPEHRALVPGDRILGALEGGLRVCPESWLRYLDSGLTGVELRAELRRLLDLPVEFVLVSHGESVLEHGREALWAALEPEGR